MPLDAQPPVLCLVTDRMRLGKGGGDVRLLLDCIAAAAAARIDLVQIREPDLSDRALGDLVSRAVEAAQGAPTRILVNDRVDVAVAHGAAGVHLKGDSVPAARVRAHAPSGWIVGRSIHGLAEGVQAAAGGGLDYVALGPVFETASKPGASPIGPAVLRQAAETLPVPVLGIGGVTADRVRAIAETGAAGLAAIGLFAALGGVAPGEFRRAAAGIRERWRTCRRAGRAGG